jgi:Domain of unknown function (DUF6968)
VAEQRAAYMKLAPISAKMTAVIAQRDLVLHVAGKAHQVCVRIGRPVQEVETASGLDWRCPITVYGVGRVRSQRGLGADSLQALVHALKLLEEEINGLETRTSGHLEWFGERWHGLPSIRLAELPLTKRRRKKLATTRVPRRTSARKQRGAPRD